MGRTPEEYQVDLVRSELVSKWYERTGRPAGTQFSKTPLPTKDREATFSKDKIRRDLLRGVALNDVITDNLVEPSLDIIPGMRELAFLQRMRFPINEDYVVLYRSTRFPTPERISRLIRDGVIDNAGQDRLEALYHDKQYLLERERVLNSSVLATGLMPQERLVPGLPVFTSILDAISVHNAFRDPDLDQIMISALAIPKSVFDGDVRLFYNPPIVDHHENDTDDFEVTNFRPFWDVDGSNRSDKRMYPNSSFYRQVFGRQLYETHLRGAHFDNKVFQELGIQVRHFLTDIYGIDTRILPGENKIVINNKEILGDAVLRNIDFLFGLPGGMDNLKLERDKATHLPFRLQEILPAASK